MWDFSGRSAVVTGAGGGMGGRVAQDLCAAGARVCMIDVKEMPDDYAAFGDRAFYCQGDVTDHAFLKDTVSAACARFGSIDYLVNAAGILLFEQDFGVVDTDFAVWDRVLDVNLKGPARLAQLCIPHMIKRPASAMVHYASIGAYRGDSKPQDAYQASKAALMALSKSIAIQFAERGLRSNVVSPGMIDTPLQARWDGQPGAREAIAAAVPLQRLGRASDLSGPTLFLLSEFASYITGTDLVVDGGLLALP
jgi:NAD(P)-dependent dehydrogenase (short-subunit alcohol dehydrogenase family)